MQPFSSSDKSYVNTIHTLIESGKEAIPYGDADKETKIESFETIRKTFVELGKVIGDHEIALMDKTNSTRTKLSNAVQEKKIQGLYQKNVDNMKKEVASVVEDVSEDSTLTKTLNTIENFETFIKGKGVVGFHNDQQTKNELIEYIKGLKVFFLNIKGSFDLTMREDQEDLSITPRSGAKASRGVQFSNHYHGEAVVPIYEEVANLF